MKYSDKVNLLDNIEELLVTLGHGYFPGSNINGSVHLLKLFRMNKTLYSMRFKPDLLERIKAIGKTATQTCNQYNKTWNGAIFQ